MLKLRRIELVGFKSFSDKGEIVVNDSGVTAIVGPNGCGKSNVSDAIAWVLGEQSAKSLRGEKMEDVIFNGTRKRSAMGMAEVTITLTDTDGTHPGLNGNGHAKANGNGNGNGNGNANGNGHHLHEARDIVVQRRLYRSGESIYSIDGRQSRLRDIQDIFLGTGLGPNSYAIIEQGRVGQLLSSKPMDRRGLIEEAAGITKFKAKRKLAESRLEAARQNLSRVNDILAEVDRQRNSLKRQASKARRYIELRDRMRDILSSVFSTRAEMLVEQQEKVETALTSIGDEGKKLESEIERLNECVHQRRDEAQSQAQALDQVRTRRTDVELEHEKTIQRIDRFQDQIRVLEDRKTALSEELSRAAGELERNREQQSERAVHIAELEQTQAGIADSLSRIKATLDELTIQRDSEEREIERLRRRQFEIVGNEARIRNEITSRSDMVQRLSAQILRLEAEAAEARSAASRIETELEDARGKHSDLQTAMNQLKTRLQETERECVRLKGELAEAVKAASAARTAQEAISHRLETIGELAVRRAYSTESVQQFFNHVRGGDWEPLGILADFVEVDPSCESIVEDFLRHELQYVVVEDRSQAERALQIVKDVTKGRLECLIMGGDAPAGSPAEVEGAIPLENVVRFDDRLRHAVALIHDAYIVDSLEQAWWLAGLYPHRRFVARTGEVVHGSVLGWGEHEPYGPLSLKREIRDLDRRLDRATRETQDRDADVARLTELVRESDILRARLVSELQEIEKTILTMDHRVRTLTADFSHAEQRRRVAQAEIERFIDERAALEGALREAEIQLSEIAATRSEIDEALREHSTRNDAVRANIEVARQELAQVQSNAAVIEERRLTGVRELKALQQQASDLEERGRRAELQIRQAADQQDQTRATVAELGQARASLLVERDTLDAAIAEATERLEELRRALREAERGWDEARTLLDSWKDRHNALEIEKTQVESALKYLSASCWNELNETIESVCLKCFDTLPVADLEEREREQHEIREKMESMGAVNMMALEEYQEAETRFVFLSTQRQDLLDSIRDTTQAIDEIDLVCRKQFREAYEAINAGFKEVFVHLFGGGHGELRLLEGADEGDGGVEIVAQPPGKKLQNVLLLSGGEKALTALALLIALFRYKPSPFCVLDEVDAPLDEANVDRFANMVRDMSQQTQFIVITHSKRTMETASALYGVTMEEPGISKIVSVRLN